MGARVSIVMACYDRASTVEAAVRSVLTQSYKGLEVLLCDDGSTDGTLDLLEKLATMDSRVRVLRMPHRGVAATLREGFGAAAGEFVGQVDSDDLLVQTAVEETVAVMEARPRLAMVYTDHLIMEEGKIKGLGARCAIPYSRDGLLTDFMTMHFRLMRRSAYERTAGFDVSLAAAVDYDVCLKVSEVGEVEHLLKPLYVYRHHAGSISVGKQGVQRECAARAVRAALTRRGMADRVELVVEGERFSLRPRG